jgi:hypothetical protein
VAITAQEARTRIVDELGAAAEQIAVAVACVGAAYELLDELTAERLEDDLFRPLQRALGRARRTNAQFADRHGLGAPAVPEPTPGVPSQGVKAFVERAAAAATEASHLIAELQDSMLPIESGDPELRGGLAETRESLELVPGAAREFLRTLGR